MVRRNAHHLPHSLRGVGWGRVEWSGVGMLTFLDHVPSTLRKMLMLRSHGVGCYNLPSTTLPRPCTRCWCYVGVTFLRPRSLDLTQDIDATLTWGGVGWGGDVNVPSATFPRPCARCWCYAHIGWGAVGWGHANVHPTLHKTLMLHQWGGVGWGDDNAHMTLRKMLMLRPRRSNYHGLMWGGVGVFSAIC